MQCLRAVTQSSALVETLGARIYCHKPFCDHLHFHQIFVLVTYLLHLLIFITGSVRVIATGSAVPETGTAANNMLMLPE